MKNYQDIKKNLAKLNEIDQQKARNIIKDLEKYTQKAEINQEGLKKLHDRLLQLLRQNHMID